MRPDLNWYGYSTETIAAIYETNMAAEENKDGKVNIEYVWTAWKAEESEMELDKAVRSNAS